MPRRVLSVHDDRTIAFALMLYRHWRIEPDQTYARWILCENAFRSECV